MPDFRAMFAPEQPNSGQPDFRSLFAPDEPAPQEPSALERYGSDAWNALKLASQYANPMQANPGFQMGLHPKESGLALLEHYKKFVTPSGVKDLVTNHPMETAVELGSIFAGGKGLGRDAVAAGKTAMPRAVVRTEGELLKTGGERMNASKLSDSTMRPEATLPAFSALNQRLAEGAVDMGGITPTARNLYKRLQALHAQEAPSPMSPLTGVQPKPPGPVSLKELHTLRRKADDVVNAGKNPDGSLNTDGFVGVQLRKAVDDMIDAHPEGSNFQIGSNEYARAKQSQILSDAYERATRSATWQNGNEAAALGNEINKILNSKRYKRTFTPEVRKRLTQLTQRDLSGLVGALGSKTVSGMAMGRLFEVSLGLPPGVLWPVGHMVRTGRNASRREAFQRIQEEIRAGGPVR